MRVVVRSGKQVKAEVQRRGGDSDVVRRDQLSLPAQRGEEFGPARGDLSIELDDANGVDKRRDPRTARSGPFRTAGEGCTDQQLGVYDRRKRHHLVSTRVTEYVLPGRSRALDRDERAGVDHESHGFLGGRSAAPTRARSSAKSASVDPAPAHAASAARSDVAPAPPAGTRRAMGVEPPRATQPSASRISSHTAV